ncbi:MAG: cell division protein SepF [Theionarchaea archaeon]|nr:cell division protein SepF [Theionarchaea archaeon]
MIIGVGMRKLSEVLGDKISKEKKYEEDYYEDRDTGELSAARGFKDVDAVKYEEDILSEEFLEYGITYVKPIKLRSLADVQKVNQELNEGNIVLGDITPLLQRDPQELKRAIDQLKGICRGIGGDIIGIGESKILVTPTNIRIYRKRE